MTNGALLAHVLRSAPKALERLSGPLGEAARAAVARHDSRPSDEKREVVSSLVREFGDVARVRTGLVTLLLPHDDARDAEDALRLDAAFEPYGAQKVRS
jgi:hypothetical protein